jgi:hypothetical protein
MCSRVLQAIDAPRIAVGKSIQAIIQTLDPFPCWSNCSENREEEVNGQSLVVIVVNVLLSSSSDVCVLSLWLADFALARARTTEPCKCITAPLSQELYPDLENAPYLSLAPSLQYFGAISLWLCRPTLEKGKLARA